MVIYPKTSAPKRSMWAEPKNAVARLGRPQELAKLLQKADDPETVLYLALGAFTGLRSAELVRLEWHDINFERGHIIVGKEKSKTATRRLVPISPNLMQWIA